MAGTARCEMMRTRVLRGPGVAAIVAVVGAVVSFGCSNGAAPPAPPPAPAVVQDAAIDGVTELPPADPRMHLDEGPPVRTAPARAKHRAARPIDITLKSVPPGALAAVDGRPIGTTPTFWAGESDGLEHEFTFTRPGYASARYRFVPITSGVLHVTLEAVAADAPDGGLAPLITPKLLPEEHLPAAPPAAPPVAPPAAGSAPGSAGSDAPVVAPPAAVPAPEPRRETGGFGPPP